MKPPKTPPGLPPKTTLKGRVRSKLSVPALRTTSMRVGRTKKSSSSLFTLSLTTAGAVALIVACTPNGGKAPITPRNSALSGFQKAVSTCTDSIRPSRKLKFGGLKRTVNVCEYPVNADGSTGTALVPVAKGVSFSVQTGDDASAASQQQSTDANSSAISKVVRRSSNSSVHLAMQVGLKTSEMMDDAAKKQFLDRFELFCQADTQAIFSRSRFESGLKLSLSLNFSVVPEDDGNFNVPPETTPGSTGSADAPLTDVEMSMTKVVDGKDTYWEFDKWPGQPRYYPQGKDAETQACVAAGGADIKVVSTCVWNHRRALNVPVCAAFAKRIGNGLGLVDIDTERATCGAAQPADVTLAAASAVPSASTEPSTQPVNTPHYLATAAEVKSVPSDSGDSSFSKPSSSDTDFMKNATLNKKDLLRILSLPCPNLKTQVPSTTK